jgi:catechol 2,3-dioxygenase-like lactoylglutathione lyase family enzyme
MMDLQGCSVGAMVPVNDMAKAKEFYEGALGLSGGTEEGDGGMTYEFGEGTRMHVYPSPGHTGSGATLAAFRTDDVDGLVDELSSNGVTFEQYDEGPFKTNEKGIAVMGEIRGGWFRDPDGNILAVANT